MSRRRCGVAPRALWLVWFCVNFSYYGAFIWLPTLLVASGFSLVRSFGYTLIITLAQLPGYAASAVADRAVGTPHDAGRRSSSGPPSRAAFFGVAGDVTTVIVAGMALSFFNLGAWGALYAVTPEIYPTRCAPPVPDGRPASAGSPRSSRRSPCRCCATPAGSRCCSGSSRRSSSLRRSGAFWLPEQRGKALED